MCCSRTCRALRCDLPRRAGDRPRRRRAGRPAHTIWFPEGALGALPDDRLAFLLFPVDRPESFDAVVLDPSGHVVEIQVKQQGAASNWIWGAFRMPGVVYGDLRDLWLARDRRDEYIGTLVNAYLAAGGTAAGVKAGRAYSMSARSTAIARLPHSSPRVRLHAPLRPARA